MSILIKDMKIPDNCGDCPFCIFSAAEKRCIGFCNTSDDDYYCKILDRFMEYDEVDGGVDIFGKPDDCPLVEVPIPHGDLIDANDLYAKFYKLEQDAVDAMRKFPIGSVGWQEANTILNERTAYKHDIMDTPVIIEAEKGEKDG